MIAARTRFLAGLILSLVLLIAQDVQAQQRKAHFIDEASQVRSFEAYRTTLLNAIAARDVNTVIASAAPDIQLDFGGGAGRDQFRKRLTLTADDLAEEYAHFADENREQYWDALEDVLRLGGVFQGPRRFIAPYTWSVELKDDEDPFDTSFVIGTGVPMRDRASKYGTVIATLSEDVVQVMEGGKGTEYLAVKTADGRRGFVHRRHLRSAIDYRAFFENSGGRWLMTLFLAGD